MTKKSPFIEEYILQKKADIALRETWVNEILFTWQWWVLVALVLILWLIWWKIVDRKKIFEIMTYGFMVMVLSSLLDAIGVEYEFWEYHYQLLPLLDVFMTYNIAVIPVTYMVIYQYFQTWKSFIICHTVLSAIFALIAEPLLVWLNYYQLLKWEYYYSFPIYLTMALILKFFVTILKRLQS